jgi:HrpA-like RNA helicase
MPKNENDAKIVVLTDGLLRSMLNKDMKDPIPQAAIVIIDEAHELSQNIEYLLAVMRVVLKRRPDLRLILMSATCNAERICRHFASFKPIQINVAGATQQLTHIWLKESDLTSSYEVLIVRSLRMMYLDPRITDGDALVFLPGVGEISQVSAQCLKVLNQEHPDAFRNVEFLRLSRDVPLDERNLVSTDRFAEDGTVKRKIIFATNIAETSITLPRIRMVVLTGKNKLSHFDPTTLATDLIPIQCSKHQLTQQAGRAGRVQPGIVVHCYHKSTYDKLDLNPVETLRHSDLTMDLIQILASTGDIRSHGWFTTPDPEQIDSALIRMADHGLINNSSDVTKLVLTDKGRLSAELELNPEMTSLFVYASPKEGDAPLFAYDILVLIAITSASGSFIQSLGKDDNGTSQKVLARFTEPSSDHLTLINLWLAWKHLFLVGRDINFCEEYALSRSTCVDIDKALKVLLSSYQGQLFFSVLDLADGRRLRYRAQENRHATIDACGSTQVSLDVSAHPSRCQVQSST